MKSNSVFMHFRKRYGYKKDFTIAVTTDRDDGQIGISFSFVNEKDQFCRKIGRAIALGRAKNISSEKTILLPMDILKSYTGTVGFLRWLVNIIDNKGLRDKEKASEIYQLTCSVCSDINSFIPSN